MPDQSYSEWEKEIIEKIQKDKPKAAEEPSRARVESANMGVLIGDEVVWAGGGGLLGYNDREAEGLALTSQSTHPIKIQISSQLKAYNNQSPAEFPDAEWLRAALQTSDENFALKQKIPQLESTIRELFLRLRAHEKSNLE